MIARLKSLFPRRHHNGWLVLIALFKLGQAALFAGIAFGAFRLVGKDVGDMLQNLADHLNFNPESRLADFVDSLLERAQLIDDHLLRRIGAAGFIYAGLDLLEGVGLYLEKVWAEYLTLLITGSFLPFEIWEVWRRVTVPSVGLFAINLAVFLYLLRVVIERRRKRSAAGQA